MNFANINYQKYIFVKRKGLLETLKSVEIVFAELLHNVDLAMAASQNGV